MNYQRLVPKTVNFGKVLQLMCIYSDAYNTNFGTLNVVQKWAINIITRKL